MSAAPIRSEAGKGAISLARPLQKAGSAKVTGCAWGRGDDSQEDKMKRTLPAVFALLAGACSAPNGGSPSIGRGEVRAVGSQVALPRNAALDASQVALQAVHADRLALGLGARDEMRLERAVDGIDGQTHVRLQQLHAGIKVWGSD